MGVDLPRYLIFGARPVKLVETEDGGMDCLAYDWDTGAFERDMGLLDRAVFPTEPDIDVVSAEEFDEHVATLRAKKARA